MWNLISSDSTRHHTTQTCCILHKCMNICSAHYLGVSSAYLPLKSSLKYTVGSQKTLPNRATMHKNTRMVPSLSSKWQCWVKMPASHVTRTAGALRLVGADTPGPISAHHALALGTTFRTGTCPGGTCQMRTHVVVVVKAIFVVCSVSWHICNDVSFACSSSIGWSILSTLIEVGCGFMLDIWLYVG
jgi:hypothetical protein